MTDFAPHHTEAKRAGWRIVVSRACCGMEDGMEGKFLYGIWKMLRMEWNGRFEKWIGRSPSILTTYTVYMKTQTNYKILPNQNENT